MGILLSALLTATLQIGVSSGDQPTRINPSIKEPRRVKSSVPQYPAEAVKAGLQGVVTVECTVGTDGRVTNATAVEGDSPLSEAAVAAVRKWRFEPLLLDGKPKDFVLTVTVNFKPVERVTVDGLCESLRSKHEAVRASAATLLGHVRPGPRVGTGDVAQAIGALDSLLEVEESQRVRAAAKASLTRLRAE